MTEPTTPEPRGRTTAPCHRCKRTRTVHGRGLCHNCYKTASSNGSLYRYDAIGTRAEAVERNKVIVERLRSGETHRSIATDLGVSADTVRAVAARNDLRRRDSDGRNFVADLPVAPERPPCVGEVMDFDGLKANELTPTRNPAVAAALALCAECPLATRQWCLDVMDPRGLSREWQGIAGGVVWSYGRLVYMPAERVAAAS